MSTGRMANGGGYEWAAGQLGVTRRTVMAWVKEGRIGYVGLPPNGHHKRFFPEHIEEFKRRHAVKAKRANAY